MTQPIGMTTQCDGKAGPGRSSDWRSALTSSIGRSRQAALRRLATEIGTAHERCQRRTAGPAGPAGPESPASFRRLPQALDRELTALSARFTGELHNVYHHAAEHTLTAAFGRMPGPAIFRRVAAGVGAVPEAASGVMLVVTADGRICRAPAAGSVPAGPAGPVLGSVQVTLSAGCYAMWQEQHDVPAAVVDGWLKHALDAVAAELLDQMMARCHEVQAALTRCVGELVPD